MTARRGLTVLHVVACLALLLVLTALPARAAGELELSADGVSWSTTLTDALFDAPVHAVPGDVITAALWVRNTSGDRARIELDVADDLGVAPGTLAGGLRLQIDGVAVTGGARWLGPELAPGASLRIPLLVTFDRAATSTSRLDAASILDTAILVQTAVGPGPVTPSATPSAGVRPTAASTVAPTSGHLAHTGSDAARALVLALVAAGAGLLLVLARRRARRDEH